jgi:hypothetical protein
MPSKSYDVNIKNVVENNKNSNGKQISVISTPKVIDNETVSFEDALRDIGKLFV